MKDTKVDCFAGITETLISDYTRYGKHKYHQQAADVEATIKSKKERGTAISGSTDYLHRHPKIGLGDSVPVVGGKGVCVSASGSDSGMS
jgi:hypothetical protein